MGTISPATLILLLLIFNCVTMTPVVGDTLQAIVENTTGEKLYFRLVYGDYGSGPTNQDYPPLAPNSTTRINITRDRPWRLFSATGCLLDSSGHLMNCRTGDCGQGGCTTEDQPIATMLAYDNGTLKPTTENGYNLGLDGKFLCSGCDCPSFTCVIPLHTCPKNLTISEDSGLIVGCKPGIGLPSGKDCPALNSNSHLPSDGATCLFKNVILQLTVSSQ